ncbi:hypothetical protein FRC12_003138 [Ceratobasidium sp. 428]|nr:hypothetical protein FRC12_003138 [Ceratobasidium sp. 428]
MDLTVIPSVPLNSDAAVCAVFEATPAQRAPLPSANPTKSFWLDSDPSANPLARAGSTGPLPDAADIVIIGSGITGCSAAYHLADLLRCSEGQVQSVSAVILEARDFCSGATGRSGGHLTAASVHDFQDRVKLHGTEEALRDVELERHTVSSILEFLEKTPNAAQEVDLVKGGHVSMASRNGYWVDPPGTGLNPGFLLGRVDAFDDDAEAKAGAVIECVDATNPPTLSAMPTPLAPSRSRDRRTPAKTLNLDPYLADQPNSHSGLPYVSLLFSPQEVEAARADIAEATRAGLDLTGVELLEPDVTEQRFRVRLPAVFSPGNTIWPLKLSVGDEHEGLDIRSSVHSKRRIFRSDE